MPDVTERKRRRPFLAVSVAATAGLLVYFGWTLISGWPVLVAGGRTRPELPASDFELTITADKSEYVVGEYPKVTARLLNRSGGEVLLVTPLEGSSRSRSPVAKLTVVPPTTALPLERVDMCGNVNAIDKSAFVRVPNNESLYLIRNTPYSLAYETNRGPGEYRIRMTYSTATPDPDAWTGGLLALNSSSWLLFEIAPLLSKVPRFRVESNELRLTFVAKFTTPLQALRDGDLNDAKMAMRELEAMSKAQWPEGYGAALLHMLARLYEPDSYSYERFAVKTLPIITASATPKEADDFWDLLAQERQHFSRRVFLDNSTSEMGASVLALILKSAPGKREERLQYLLNRQEYNEPLRGENLDPVRPGLESIKVLASAKGEDIDRALVALANQAVRFGGPDSQEGKLLTKTLIRRGLKPEGTK